VRGDKTSERNNAGVSSGAPAEKNGHFYFPPQRGDFFVCALLVLQLEGRPGEIISREPSSIAFSDQFLKSPGQARNTDKTDESATGGNKIVHFFEIGKRHLSATACHPRCLCVRQVVLII